MAINTLFVLTNDDRKWNANMYVEIRGGKEEPVGLLMDASFEQIIYVLLRIDGSVVSQ